MRSRRPLIDRRSFAFGGLTGALLVVGAEPVFAAADTAGKVSRLDGSAEAKAASGSRKLAPAMPVFVADVVRTGAESRLGLNLGDRTTLNLGASTEIKIDKFLIDAGGTIDLIDGTVMFEHDGPRSDSGLEFRSPYGLIAVRGTRFYAGPSNGVFGVLVSTGSVVVTAGGKSVTVRPQEGTDIAAPGAVPSDPKPWGLKRIRAMQAAVR